MSQQKIHRAQIEILYSHVPSTIASSIVAAVVLVVIQWSTIPHLTLLTWLTGLLLAFALRYTVYYRYRHTEKPDPARWETYYIIAALPTFMAWAVAGVLLFPHGEPLHQAATMLTIFGIAAGGSSSLSARKLPVLIFLPFVLIPVAVTTALEGTSDAVTMAALILVYGIFLYSVALKAYQNHLDNISLRLQSHEREQKIRKLERRARTNLARLSEAERIGHMGSWEWDIATNKMYWSKETYRIFGLDPDQVKPSFKLFIEQVVPEQREGLQQGLQQAVATDQPCSQICNLLSSCKAKTVRGVGKPVRDKNGKVVRITGIVQDISEQVALENQLLHAQKMESIGTLVGGIAHDFNNMLGSLLGQAYMAKKEVRGNTELLRRIENMERTSNRAAKMVQQLLVFARKDDLQLQAVDIHAFLQESKGLNEAAVPETITVKHRLGDKPIFIEGDKAQLQQVILNLLNNAIHAVRDTQNPRIIIGLEYMPADNHFKNRFPQAKHDAYAHLFVQDNGCGMSEEETQHIFEPFFTTKEVGQGTGLGLAMVYGAVQNHHGMITVDSRQGKGSTFHIYLPATQTASELHSQSLSIQGMQPFRENAETVLLVDDDTMLRDALQEALESLGYHVLTAKDGKEAVATFREHKNMIDLVISDIVMPNMDGHEAAQHIRDIAPGIPIIFMSGYDPQQLSASQTPENSVLIRKPIPIDKLDRHIRRLLDKA